ncbi:MAG: LPP20 family lipoprotein [Deferribacteraceae bacterium]|jgi:hypothetical protein|nr:LPP20 family lipoprotein [Deferribacteraceae bacterium]
MKHLLLLLTILALISACGGKTVNNNALSKQERASAAQAQRDLAMQELDEGETPYVAKTKLTPAQQRALEAHRELECSLKGGCPTPKTPEETPPTDAAVIPQIPEKQRPDITPTSAERPGKIPKYPFLNGFPIWFSNPIYDGYFGGVGVAKPQKSGGLPVQRKVAIALAQADLARNIETVVNNEYISERISVDKQSESYYVEKFSTMSRQETEQLLKNPTVIDEWLNEETGEFFVWVAVKH